VDKNSHNGAAGIQVSPDVVKAERSGVENARAPDHATRYHSASCALTSDTKAFMLLLPNGTVVDLDEGGNTMAWEAFQSSSAGRAILNGKVGGIKPQAKIVGVRVDNRLKARTVEMREPQPAAAAK
jgi:hypothetical protein